MRGAIQSVRDLARDYAAEFGLTRTELVSELILGTGILLGGWCLSALALAAFGQ